MFFDIRNVVAGDPSPDGKGKLEICRGIEVGHIFQLRTKYAEALNCAFLDEQGKSQIMEMGCYGIGVSRIVGAAIEQGNDDKGIILPPSIAPFAVCIVPMGYHKSEAVKAASRPTLCRPEESWHRRSARRPQRAPGRHVRRHGTDRYPASRGYWRTRTEGWPTRVQGPHRYATRPWLPQADIVAMLQGKLCAA